MDRVVVRGERFGAIMEVSYVCVRRGESLYVAQSWSYMTTLSPIATVYPIAMSGNLLL